VKIPEKCELRDAIYILTLPEAALPEYQMSALVTRLKIPKQKSRANQALPMSGQTRQVYFPQAKCTVCLLILTTSGAEKSHTDHFSELQLVCCR